MIFETFDATYLQYVINQPSMRDSFGIPLKPDQIIHCEHFASDDRYKIITNGLDAFIVAEQTSPVLYSLHLVFDHTCRGRRAIEEGRRMVEWLWENTQAQMLYGAVPIANPKSRMFCRLFGCTSDGPGMLEAGFERYPVEWFHIMRPATPA